MDKESKNQGGLELANAARAAMRAAGTLERLDPIEKSRRNPKSLRLAVIAKCWECAGGGQDGVGATKETIRTCTVACPLRSMRPYQKDTAWVK